MALIRNLIKLDLHLNLWESNNTVQPETAMGNGFIISNCEIGAAIKRRRHELLLSQEALSSMLDVSFQQIQRYENGTDTLNVERLQALAHALSVPIGYFFSSNKKINDLFETECWELIDNFRKIRKKEIKTLVVEFARTCAQWEFETGNPPLP